MFHFPTFPPHALCVQARVTPHDWCGVPPFGHPRINARLAAPRGLSQPPTSFIGSWCPGIHRVPSTSWPHKTHPTHHPAPSEEDTRPANEAGNLQANSAKQRSKDARVHCAVLNDQPVTPGGDPTSPDPPPQGHPPQGGDGRAVWDPGGPGRGERLHHPPGPQADQMTGSAPSGPNSVPTTPVLPLRPRSSPPRTRERPYWEPARSRRPNWSAFHPRAPPRNTRPAPLTGTGSRSGRGSGPTDTPPKWSALPARCSLERR
jgi:hypothetical protein